MQQKLKKKKRNKSKEKLRRNCKFINIFIQNIIDIYLYKLSTCVLGSNYWNNARAMAINKSLLNNELRKKKKKRKMKHIAAKYD